ncbi:MAG: DUF2332 domain-containing protein [Shimia sp.]
MNRLRAAFESQGRACANLGSPFMGRLMPLIPDLLDPATPVGARLLDWPGDVAATGDSVPLRLAGALHALQLTGADPALSAVYPPAHASDTALAAQVARALTEHEAHILHWLDSPPQTNEVRRAAVLIAVGHWLTARLRLPLITSELGASAGLNLPWDFFHMQAAGLTLGPEGSSVRLAPEWRGMAPTLCPPYIHEARGVDLNPLDPVADALRLQAYLWPDQPERLARTRAAIAIASAPDSPASVDQGDAVEWLRTRLDQPAGFTHLVYSTVAWQYLPEARRAEGAALIAAAGARATAQNPLAWFRMEPDATPRGAGLLLRLWPGDLTIPLGRVDFHGRWVEWAAPPP